MLKLGRRELLLGAVALIAACNGSNASGAGTVSGDDMILGAANAPVTLIEYGSVTCPHCAEFEREVFASLKANYIDTGKVRFIFREFPAGAPADIVVAEFQLARCNHADAGTYFNRVNALMQQRDAILASGTRDGVRQKLIEFGASAGLSGDQVTACIADPAGGERMQRIMTASEQFQVSGTPTLILNGQKLDTEADPSLVTYPGLARALDAAIARHR